MKALDVLLELVLPLELLAALGAEKLSMVRVSASSGRAHQTDEVTAERVRRDGGNV